MLKKGHPRRIGHPSEERIELVFFVVAKSDKPPILDVKIMGC
jgi:hypothetical protein